MTCIYFGNGWEAVAHRYETSHVVFPYTKA